MGKSNSSKKRNKVPRSKNSLMHQKLVLRPRSAIHTNGDKPNSEDDHENTRHIKKKKIFNRASPMKLVRLYASMTTDQKILIRDSDFGGLLDIKCSKLQPELCLFLMENFNPSTCELVFPTRGVIPITEQDVQRVLGIPMGDKDVCYELDAEAITFMLEQFGIENGKQPLMSTLEEKLVGMSEDDNRYLRFWIIYAMCSVLAPTTSNQVSPRCFPSLVNIKQVRQLNFCKFVIKMLQQAAKSKADKSIFKACMLFLMIHYVDSLDLKDMQVSSHGTRVAVWTNAMVTKAISQDLRSDGSFGMAPLKKELSNGEEPFESEEASVGESILFTDSKKVEVFIQRNTPSNCTPEDAARYKEAVEEACQGFESVLQNFLWKLSHKRSRPSSESDTQHINQMARHSAAKRRTRRAAAKKHPHGAHPYTEAYESDNASDEDYDCEGEARGDSDSNVSLEDESVDLRGSCSYRALSDEDEHESVNGLIVRRNKRARTEMTPKCKKFGANTSTEQGILPHSMGCGHKQMTKEDNITKSSSEQTAVEATGARSEQMVGGQASGRTVVVALAAQNNSNEETAACGQKPKAASTDINGQEPIFQTAPSTMDVFQEQQHQDLVAQITNANIASPAVKIHEGPLMDLQIQGDGLTLQVFKTTLENKEDGLANAAAETLAQLCENNQSTNESCSQGGQDDQYGRDRSTLIVEDTSSFNLLAECDRILAEMEPE